MKEFWLVEEPEEPRKERSLQQAGGIQHREVDMVLPCLDTYPAWRRARPSEAEPGMGWHSSVGPMVAADREDTGLGGRRDSHCNCYSGPSLSWPS